MADNKNKRWALTVYEEQYALVDELAKDDKFVKEIGWQDEVCGSTGRKHRQAYLITQQPQRFSAIKGRIPGVHIEVCRDIVALKKYCFKEDTRDENGTNKKITNPPTHIRVDMFMEMLAEYLFAQEGISVLETHPSKKLIKEEYWRLVGYLLYKRPELAALAMQPGPQALWANTRSVWLGRVHLRTWDSISITESPADLISYV